MAKLREHRIPEVDRFGRTVTRVVLVDDMSKRYDNPPRTREIERRKRQNANSKAAAR